MASLNFFRAFRHGSRSYNTRVGEWWVRQSTDASHKRAYKKIAAHIRRALRRYRIPAPHILVDYACGTGEMLKYLALEFPSATLVALDGSGKMLRFALKNLTRQKMDAEMVLLESAFRKTGPRVRLVQSALPNFSLSPRKADAVLFLFPNMNFSATEKRYIEARLGRNAPVLAMARLLSRMWEDAEGKSRRAQKRIFEELLQERILSRNVHQLLRRGGLWFKVEYSNLPRHELSELEQWRMLFAEAAWHPVLDSRQTEDPFEYLGSKYFRSRVALDVYEQTLDPVDRTGGYFISAFRAL